MQKMFSVQVGDDVPNEGRARRSILSPNELLKSPAPFIETLYDVLQYDIKEYGDRNAFGYRKVDRIVEEQKEIIKIVAGVETKEVKTWKYFQLSKYHYYTYREVGRITRDIGAGMRKLGLEPHDKIELFASTSADWMLVAHGAFTQSLTIVTAYDTLGEAGLLHSMNETAVGTVFTNAELLPTMEKVISKCSTLKHIIYNGDAKSDLVEKIKANHPQLENLISLEELKKIGQSNPIQAVPPKADDLCCIMYTSGSTGNPKGVILKHSNLVSGIAGVNRLLQHLVEAGDCIMAYLPLAHVLEFLVENLCMFWGVTLGYATVRTLTDASVRNCQGDIREFRPTLMTGVPAVWESIRKAVLSKVNNGSPMVQRVFHAAFAAKAWCMEKGLPTGWLDFMIFNKIKDQTGGRLRFALSGGASISQETQHFLSVTLCPILQGYGMTESCGMCTVLPPEQFAVGRVGTPVPCVEIKLVDVPDANYRSTNSPRPQGEVWIRGGSITSGYWANEALTKETITEDGWLLTGDIGEWHENGTLSIIDRKKNLVKMSHGEYIALEKLESVYKSSLVVSNICVYGNAYSNKPVALVVPVESQLRKLAASQEITDNDYENLCNNESLKKAVLDSLLAVGKKASLKPVEGLGAVHLCHEEWTCEGGLMTAAQKIKRKDIQKKFQKELDIMSKSQRA